MHDQAIFKRTHKMIRLRRGRCTYERRALRYSMAIFKLARSGDVGEAYTDLLSKPLGLL